MTTQPGGNRTGRSQDPEKLTFLSATLGDHMVLQQAPKQAVVWGFTAPGATVTTTMQTSAASAATSPMPDSASAQSFTVRVVISRKLENTGGARRPRYTVYTEIGVQPHQCPPLEIAPCY